MQLLRSYCAELLLDMPFQTLCITQRLRDREREIFLKQIGDQSKPSRGLTASKTPPPHCSMPRPDKVGPSDLIVPCQASQPPIRQAIILKEIGHQKHALQEIYSFTRPPSHALCPCPQMSRQIRQAHLIRLCHAKLANPLQPHTSSYTRSVFLGYVNRRLVACRAAHP